MKKKYFIVISFVILSIVLIYAGAFSSDLSRYEYFITGDDDLAYIHIDGGGSPPPFQTATVGIVGTNETFVIKGVVAEVVTVAGTEGINYTVFANIFNAAPNLTTCYKNLSRGYGEFEKNYTSAAQYWINISMSVNATILKGERFCVYLNSTAGGDAEIGWRRDNSGGYAGGRGETEDNMAQDDDYMFEVWGEGPSVIVVLNTPTNNSQERNIAIEFNATSSESSIGSLSSITLKVWNSSSVLHYNQTKSSSGSSSEDIFFYSFPYSDNYTWNFLTCLDNDFCNYSGSNYTVQCLDPINTYAITTSEGEENTYTINLTNGTNAISTSQKATLVWNNTKYSSSKRVINSSYFEYSTTVTVPIGSGSSTGNNISFYWDYGTANTTSTNQTIFSLNIDDCTTNTFKILNLTLRDEESKSPVRNDTSNSSFIEVELNLTSLSDSSVTKNFSKIYVNSSEANVCVNEGPLNETDFRLDATIKYLAPIRVTEYYMIHNYTQNNNTAQNISLYDLALVDSTTFVMTFLNPNGVAVENAVINLYRKYVGDGLFRIVEAPVTDSDGKVGLHLVEEDIIYFVKVYKEGQLLYTSEQFTALCQTTPICEFTLRQGAVIGDYTTGDFDRVPEGSYVFTSSKSTRTVSVIYNWGTTSRFVNFSVFEMSNNQSVLDTVINTTSENNTANTLSLNVPISFGNKTFYAVFYVDHEKVGSAFIDLKISPQDYWGSTATFLVALIVLTLGLLAVYSGVFVVVFMVFGLMVVGFMGIFEWNWTAMISLLVGGIVIIIGFIMRRKA